MIKVNTDDPLWLQMLLETAVRERWCLSIKCTTCPNPELRESLGLLEKVKGGRPKFHRFTQEAAEKVVVGLRECSPILNKSFEFEAAVRWVIYEIWVDYQDKYFDVLVGTFAGSVLESMREHAGKRSEARRIHNARQGVKKRDWKE